MKKRKLELSSEQAAYWLIKTYITKACEISRLNNSSKDKQEFSKIIRSISLYNWNTVFMILSKRIQNINSREPISQTTSKDMHTLTDVILQETLEKLGIDEKLPSIDLTERQSTCSTIEMGVIARNVFVTSKKDRNKLPKYIKNYDFVLSSDEHELEIYNLILSIIISVRRKNNRFNSLNIIKEVFCEKSNIEEASEVFDRVIEVLKEYSIIKVETQGKESIIVEWPIDEENINEDYYSDLVLEKYNEFLASSIKEYVPPITREERREFKGIERAKKVKTPSENLLEMFQIIKKILEGMKIPYYVSLSDYCTIEAYYNGLRYKILINSDGLIKLYKSNEIDFDVFPPEELALLDKKDGKKIDDNAYTWEVTFNLASSDFKIEITNTEDENDIYSFVLNNNILTIRHNNICVSIDLEDNTITTQVECVYGKKIKAILERKLSTPLKVIHDIVIIGSDIFDAEEFRNGYYNGNVMFDVSFDKCIVRSIENINLWIDTPKTKELVIDLIRSIKSSLLIPSLIESIDNCLNILEEKGLSKLFVKK